MTIITHGGTPHLDDYVACALAWACALKTGTLSNWDSPVEILRRDPTRAELMNPEIFVLDVGGSLNPGVSNYDHHQLPREKKECAMTLLAQHYGLRDTLGRIFPWFETRGEVDATGPFATAKARGLEWDRIEPFLGPFESIVLEQFASDPVNAVKPMAKRILHAVMACDRVKYHVEYRNIGDVMVVDFTDADPVDVQVVDRAFLLDDGVAIYHDDRGKGLMLLRIHDDPRIDFSLVDGDPRVAFAHVNGFVCKTVSKDMDAADDLIGKSTKETAALR